MKERWWVRLFTLEEEVMRLFKRYKQVETKHQTGWWLVMWTVALDGEGIEKLRIAINDEDRIPVIGRLKGAMDPNEPNPQGLIEIPYSNGGVFIRREDGILTGEIYPRYSDGS
jgi:hypothetical protein